MIEEHDDNPRFLKDCEEWFGQDITILRSEKYGSSAHQVFRKTRYLVGPTGARCTIELKKKIRFAYQRFDDLVIFGYTADELHRSERLKANNLDMKMWDVLIEQGFLKADCLGLIERMGIQLPAMYLLGYKNNNCIGCVKSGGMGYWNKIRDDFPDRFEEMAVIEEELGRTLLKRVVNGETQRMTLRDLKRGEGDYPQEQEIQCGIFCAIAADIIK